MHSALPTTVQLNKRSTRWPQRAPLNAFCTDRIQSEIGSLNTEPARPQSSRHKRPELAWKPHQVRQTIGTVSKFAPILEVRYCFDFQPSPNALGLQLLPAEETAGRWPRRCFSGQKKRGFPGVFSLRFLGSVRCDDAVVLEAAPTSSRHCL